MNRYRILVVEDEVIVSKEIEERLAAMGYEMIGSVASGERALEFVAQHRPGLVLMDIRLQGAMDGISAAKEIRRRFHLPVIFLTAYSENATLERAKLAEPYGYILKPFSDQELKSSIEIALHKHRAEREILRLNRLYDVLSQVNQAVVRVSSREELLRAVCGILVERGAIDLAWIGWLDAAASKILPVAQCGQPEDLLSRAVFTTDDRPEGQCNPGRAVREGKPCICNECPGRDCLYPAEYAPVRFDFKSCGSFPIHFQGRVCGVLTLGIEEAGFFQEREIALLKEVAMDISFALDKLESDVRREQAEEDLRQKNRQLQETIHDLEQAQNILQSVIESIPLRVFWKDSDSRFLGCNSLFARDAGLNHPRELLGRDDFAMTWAEQASRYRADDREVMESGLPKMNIVEPQTAPTGSMIWLSTSKVPLRLPSGEIFGVLGIYEDITEIKRNEESLRESEERYRVLFEGSIHGIAAIDIESRRFAFANPSFCRMLGYSEKELLESGAEDVYPQESLNTIFSLFASWSRGEKVPSVVLPCLRRDGTLVYSETTGTVTTIRGKQYVVGFFADVTERRRAEEEKAELQDQLRRMQKMEAIGTLAGGIAHDFNNILSAIIGHSEMAQDYAAEGTALRDHLQQVLQAGYRAKDLVYQILTFSRQRGDQEIRPVTLGPIVKEALKLLRPSLPSTIQIRWNISPESGTIMGDPSQLHQVLMNLCTNSAHAMRELGGLLELELNNVELDAETAKAHGELQQGPHLRLTVRDTGQGMDPATLERIFDPYFTTKGPGDGTGLGLAVVHGIVKSHGGAVTVQSKPGQGTSFEILLPRIEAVREEAAPPRGEVPKGNERILFVDDEAVLVELGQSVLSKLGYRVTTSTKSAEALELFRADPSAFDLVITDYTMPQMTGAGLALEMRRIRQDIPVILCTGYSELITESKAKEMGIRAFVMKPITRRSIAETIREVLD